MQNKEQTIAERIDNVIDRRKGRGKYVGRGHLDTIKEKKTFFSKLLRDLTDYQLFRKTVLDQIDKNKGEFYEMSLKDSEFKDNVINCLPDKAIISVQRALAECSAFEKRFDRDIINISVVGEAGSGKSRLLQTICGVGDDIIPSDKGGDVTGAKSTVSNHAGDTYAEITFYSEQEIMTEVQGYLDALNSGIRLSNFNEIQFINVDSINTITTTGASLLDHLRKYVDNFSKYSSKIGKKETIEASDIRSYVSQFAVGNTSLKYYTYLGVKQADIFTEFRIPDVGKVRLIDTIGIGDTALNIEKKMLETLKNDSDSAIVLRKNDTTRWDIRDKDNILYDKLKEALGDSCIEYWLCYVVNAYGGKDERKAGEAIRDNLLNQKNRKISYAASVDCANYEEVRDSLLIPLLSRIENNLDRIDNELLKSANVLFSEAHKELFGFYTDLQKILAGGLKEYLQSGGKNFDDLFDEMEFSSELKKLENKYKPIPKDKRSKDPESKELLEAIEEVTKFIATRCPTEDEISKRLARGDQEGGPDEVYHYFAGNLRAKVREDFEEVNKKCILDIQDSAKREIIKIIRSSEGGSLGMVPLIGEIPCPSEGDDNSIEWLGVFIEERLHDYPLVKGAFTELFNRKLLIADVVEDKVEKALRFLVPDPNNESFVKLIFKDMTDEEIAYMIEQTLSNTIQDISDDLLNGIKDMLSIPYRRFYTWVNVLRDKLFIKKEGKRDLKNFYRDEAASFVWKDKIIYENETNEAKRQWIDFSERFSKYISKDSYIVKIEQKNGIN